MRIFKNNIKTRSYSFCLLISPDNNLTWIHIYIYMVISNCSIKNITAYYIFVLLLVPINRSVMFFAGWKFRLEGEGPVSLKRIYLVVFHVVPREQPQQNLLNQPLLIIILLASYEEIEFATVNIFQKSHNL